MSPVSPFVLALLLVGPHGSDVPGDPLPRDCPRASVTQVVGVTAITVAFGRPIAHGDVFGTRVPWDEPWLPGADEPTTISFANPMLVGGSALDAGTYVIRAWPGPKAWKLELCRPAPAPGGPLEVVAGWETNRVTHAPTGRLTWSIEPLNDVSARIDLLWERVLVAFPVAEDPERVVAPRARAAVAAAADDGDVLYHAARWWLDARLDPLEALPWATRARSLTDDAQAWFLEARLLRAAQRPAEALKALEQAIERADRTHPAEVTSWRRLAEAWR